MGAAARAVARRAARGGRDRVVAGSGRLQPRAGEKGGSATGPSPVDRARSGSKHHLLVDASGIPLAWTLTGGNRNDVTQLIPLLERVPPVRGKVGRPRRRPDRVTPTAATTTTSTGASCASAGSGPRSPAARREHGSGLGRVAGSSSAPSPGCTTSSGCSSATTAAPRSTRPSSRSAAASSASGGFSAHSESSSKKLLASRAVACRSVAGSGATQVDRRSCLLAEGVAVTVLLLPSACVGRPWPGRRVSVGRRAAWWRQVRASLGRPPLHSSTRVRSSNGRADASQS